jgi:hypothetical protein
MRMIKQCAVVIAAASLTGIAGCSLDLQNPNSPTTEQVTSTPDGIIALATGLQARFSTSYFNFAYMAGLVTDEFSATTAALISISDAEQGAVPSGTGIADNVFNSVYRTVRTADDLLAGADALESSFEPGTRSGMKALALTLKAESIGEAMQTYQKAPAETYGITAPTYATRAVLLPHVRALLDSAAGIIAATPPSSFFNANILTPGVNLPNLIHLYRARYARMANDDAAAIAASNLVTRTGTAALSVLTYPTAAVPNPYANVTGGTNGIAPRRAFRTSMAAGDGRASYFVVASNTLVGRLGTPIDNWNRYASTTAPLVLYFPDEALLIKAEALARTNQLAQAQAVLDSVRTDCPGGRGVDDPKACLAPLTGALTQAQLIDEIYNQRRFELYSSGLRWEDARRRGLIRGPVTAPSIPLDGQRCWIPYSVGDRNANPNATFAALPDPVEPITFPATCPTP